MKKIYKYKQILIALLILTNVVFSKFECKSQTILVDTINPNYTDFGGLMEPYSNCLQIVGSSYTGFYNSFLNYAAIGEFDADNTAFDTIMSYGYILSTGRVIDAMGSSSSWANSTFYATGSSLLDLIDTNSLTTNASIMELDFFVYYDTFKLNYIFASEEYHLNGVGQNDRMGIFLTGPNPDGGNYTDSNIAYIPGSNSFISTHTVHPWSNSDYYNYNNGALSGTFAYNGYTDKLTAWAKVVPGMQYRLKIAIADGGISGDDSAVFLEWGSFICSYVPILFVNCDSIDCYGGATYLDFDVLHTTMWNWEIIWDNGLDVWDTSGLLAGNYTVTVYETAGSTWIFDSTEFSFSIGQAEVIVTSISASEALCFGDSSFLQFSAIGGTPPLVLPNDSFFLQGNYAFFTTDSNNCVDTVEYEVGPEELVLNAITDGIICHEDSTLINFSATGGTSPYFLPADTFLYEGAYSFIVIDTNNCTDSIYFELINPDDIIIDFEVTDASSQNSADGMINTIVSGGVQPYSFLWSEGETSEDLLQLFPGYYFLSLTDYNSCLVIDSAYVGYEEGIIEMDNDKLIKIIPNPFYTETCISFSNKMPSRIEIFDSKGIEVKIIETNLNTNKLFVGNGLESGVYFVRINFRNVKTIYRKIIKL